LMKVNKNRNFDIPQSLELSAVLISFMIIDIHCVLVVNRTWAQD
jgi:hypothetical protein